MTDFTVLAARARGLRSHFAGRAELQSLAASADLPTLTRALQTSGRLGEPLESSAGVDSLERAVRRHAARDLQTLARWALGQPEVLTVCFAELDRLTLRALFRGLAQGAPAAQRLAAAVPTPLLPERALTELARQATAAEVVAHLAVLGHPDAARLFPLAQLAHPDLFALELALLRGASERVVAAARRGDANLRQLVAWQVDLANLQTALVLAGAARDFHARDCFVDRGREVSLALYEQVAAQPTRAEAVAVLRRALAPGPLAGWVRSGLANAPRLEASALQWLLAGQRRAARLDPLGSAPLMVFLLGLQAQRVDLARIGRGVGFGLPSSRLVADLVTPWN